MNIRSGPYALKNSRRSRGVLDIFLPTYYFEDPKFFPCSQNSWNWLARNILKLVVDILTDGYYNPERR